MQIQNNIGITSFKSLVLSESTKEHLSRADSDTKNKVNEIQERLDNTEKWDLYVDFVNSNLIPSFVKKDDDKTKYQSLDPKYVDGKEIGAEMKILKDGAEPEDGVAIVGFESYKNAREANTRMNELENECRHQNDGYFYLGSVISRAADVTESLEKSGSFMVADNM